MQVNYLIDYFMESRKLQWAIVDQEFRGSVELYHADKLIQVLWIPVKVYRLARINSCKKTALKYHTRI